MLCKSCVGIAIALFLTGTASAAPAEKFSSGPWTGAAVHDGGKFLTCRMWASYINRWDLVFAIDQAGYFSLLLRRQDLDLLGDMLFGNKTAIRMQIDDTPLIIRPFTAIAPRILETKFASNLDWVERLQTGKALRINFGSKVYRFPLSGVKDAMVLLKDCAAKHKNA
jgi:hypothetical protein